jgi:hypothetical protein
MSTRLGGQVVPRGWREVTKSSQAHWIALVLPSFASCASNHGLVRGLSDAGLSFGCISKTVVKFTWKFESCNDYFVLHVNRSLIEASVNCV